MRHPHLEFCFLNPQDNYSISNKSTSNIFHGVTCSIEFLIGNDSDSETPINLFKKFTIYNCVVCPLRHAEMIRKSIRNIAATNIPKDINEYIQLESQYPTNKILKPKKTTTINTICCLTRNKTDTANRSNSIPSWHNCRRFDEQDRSDRQQ